VKIILNSISTSIKDSINKYKVKFILTVIFIISLSVLLTIISINRKQITISIDGKQKNVITLANTVEKLLNNEKITLGSKDKINLPLTSKIKDKDIISIKRAVNITINMDNKVLSTKSSEDNIDLLLKAEGIALNSEDKVVPDIKTKLTDGLEVDLIRVTSKTFKDSVPLSYETVVKSNSNLPNTSRKVIQEGKDGEEQITSTVVYENDKEVSRKVVSKIVNSKPVTKIIAQGTLPVLPISRGGDSVAYTKVIKVRATAYYAVRGVGHTSTASGRLAVRDYNGGYSTIAVDPSVIPYGTRLFIQGYGFAIAADTGSAIIGNTIDVFFNTYGEACNWSTRYVNMYILK
jgi:uncharacterized protein YabE (DUF348 family)